MRHKYFTQQKRTESVKSALFHFSFIATSDIAIHFFSYFVLEMHMIPNLNYLKLLDLPSVYYNKITPLPYMDAITNSIS